MKRLNKLFNYLLIFLVSGYGLFFLLNDSPAKSPKNSGQFDFSSNDVDQVVNKYLKQTTENIQHEQFTSQRVLDQALKQPIKLTPSSKETNPADIPASQQIWKESDVSATPSEIINNSVYDEMLAQKEDEQERKQYAKDFIENARRGGFHVVLSEDLTKIISVTPIRKPSQDDDSVETNPSN